MERVRDREGRQRTVQDVAVCPRPAAGQSRARPWSTPRRTAAPRPSCPRWRRGARPGRPWPPATRSTIAPSPSRPSRLRASAVTCACPAQGGRNSGRKVTTSSTGKRRDALDHAVEQLERGRVAPVRVLQHHQHGVPRRQCLELGEQRPEGARLLLLRRERREGVALVGSAGRVDRRGTEDVRATPPPGPSRASSLASLCRVIVARAKPAARSSCSITGCRALFWWNGEQW